MVPADAAAEIERRLARAEAGHGVRILLAVESGSRAWGFPSPDSDYDARFIYVRPFDEYVSIAEPRDVIEQPIEGLYDVNGWDLRKALRLLIKPNPVLLEWLQSPHFYRREDQAVTALWDVAVRTAHAAPCRHHYAGLARTQIKRHLSDATVSLKKYFYVIRPALALRWLRMRPGELPPMTLAELRAGVDLSAEFEAILDDLVAKKAATREMGDGPRIPLIDALVEAELRIVDETQPPAQAPEPGLRADADRVFRAIARRYG